MPNSILQTVTTISRILYNKMRIIWLLKNEISVWIPVTRLRGLTSCWATRRSMIGEAEALKHFLKWWIRRWSTIRGVRSCAPRSESCGRSTFMMKPLHWKHSSNWWRRLSWSRAVICIGWIWVGFVTRRWPFKNYYIRSLECALFCS